jgi:hypothetical protein
MEATLVNLPFKKKLQLTFFFLIKITLKFYFDAKLCRVWSNVVISSSETI